MATQVPAKNLKQTSGNNLQQFSTGNKTNSLQIRAPEPQPSSVGGSSMSPYSILTSSSCSSSSIGASGGSNNGKNDESHNLISPTNLMQKLGHFLPYSFNGGKLATPVVKNSYQGNYDENMPSYDENLSSINNAAAAYALYGRMLQQQVCDD